MRTSSRVPFPHVPVAVTEGAHRDRRVGHRRRHGGARHLRSVLVEHHLPCDAVVRQRDEVPRVERQRHRVLDRVPRAVVPGGELVAVRVGRPERVPARVGVSRDDVVAAVVPGSRPVDPGGDRVRRAHGEVLSAGEVVVAVEDPRALAVVTGGRVPDGVPVDHGGDPVAGVVLDRVGGAAFHRQIERHERRERGRPHVPRRRRGRRVSTQVIAADQIVVSQIETGCRGE